MYVNLFAQLRRVGIEKLLRDGDAAGFRRVAGFVRNRMKLSSWFREKADWVEVVREFARLQL